MIINDEIRIKYKIRRKSGFYSLSDSVRRNLENYDKKEDNREK